MRRMQLANGESFAGFTIIRLLGSGGTGTVYLAERSGLPQQVALKIVRADVSADPGFRDRFIHDVDTAATLDHPSIAAVVDRGESDRLLWVATEFIDGPDTERSLRERFPNGMSVQTVVTIIGHIAEALDHAHARNLVHRHVSSANILLENPESSDFRVLLTDFGTGRRLETVGGLQSVYAAPEQITGKSVDGRADQYGLAATAFHLLTGAPPANARPPVIDETRSELADVSPVLARALAEDPTERFDTCRRFAEALDRGGEKSGGTASAAAARPPARVDDPPPMIEASHRPETTGPEIAAQPESTPAPTDVVGRRLWMPVVLTLVAVTAIVAAGLIFSKPRPRPSAPSLSAKPTAAPVSVALPPPPSVLACGDPRVAADALPLRDKLAQLLMVGVTGGDDARAVVVNQHVGGIFIGSWTDLAMLQDNSLRALENSTGPLPLAVSVDEEGGRVERLAKLIGDQDSPRQLARTLTTEQVHDIAFKRGEAMYKYGITIDFAPVVDVTAAPDDTVIGDRSFGSDPDTVVRYAGAYAQGLRDAGLLPVLKHFPGHGHASGDSHLGGVTTPPLEDLKKDDLVPYGALTPVNRVAVMVGHMQVPGLTDDKPASLSEAAYDLLRSGDYGGPGFPGLVFTDDLSSMGAINQRYSVPDAVLLALQAGADTALWITTDQVPAVLNRLEQAVSVGELSKDRVTEALHRVALGKGPHPNCPR
jgi:beta-glucosidase-like glycosyl hydrolase/serine/threonine protein kinase